MPVCLSARRADDWHLTTRRRSIPTCRGMRFGPEANAERARSRCRCPGCRPPSGCRLRRRNRSMPRPSRACGANRSTQNAVVAGIHHAVRTGAGDQHVPSGPVSSRDRSGGPARHARSCNDQAAAGDVRGLARGYGNTVITRDDLGRTHLYGASAEDRQPGSAAVLDQGQMLGTLGSTGPFHRAACALRGQDQGGRAHQSR